MDIIGAQLFFYQSLIMREDNRFVVWNYCPKALPTPSVPAFRNISSFRKPKKKEANSAWRAVDSNDWRRHPALRIFSFLPSN